MQDIIKQAQRKRSEEVTSELASECQLCTDHSMARIFMQKEQAVQRSRSRNKPTILKKIQKVQSSSGQGPEPSNVRLA